MLANNEPSNGQSTTRERVVRLDLGTLCSTPGALEAIDADSIIGGIRRHRACDWGDVCAEDKAANDHALVSEGRVISSYLGRDGTKFWIITEADRSSTTVLLPEEY